VVFYRYLSYIYDLSLHRMKRKSPDQSIAYFSFRHENSSLWLKRRLGAVLGAKSAKDFPFRAVSRHIVTKNSKRLILLTNSMRAWGAPGCALLAGHGVRQDAPYWLGMGRARMYPTGWAWGAPGCALLAGHGVRQDAPYWLGMGCARMYPTGWAW
jgi:hypothetical protein